MTITKGRRITEESEQFSGDSECVTTWEVGFRGIDLSQERKVAVGWSEVERRRVETGVNESCLKIRGSCWNAICLLLPQHSSHTMLVSGTRQKAIAGLRIKPPRFLSLAYHHQAQALIRPLHLYYFRDRTQTRAAKFTQRRLFAHTTATMTAQKLDGTAIAKSIREKLNGEVLERQKSNPRYKPSLVIIQGSVDKDCLLQAFSNSTNSW
jgi:hypothetical protein